MMALKLLEENGIDIADGKHHMIKSIAFICDTPA